ncbi:MAG: Glu/Leu/Phe/Val dehydrogenase, partial [Desulfobacteraceae bacterium]|nr:Glu/Leu/Phe/Val dehydrogenase [Desulfobacteraceae bacterium]
MIPHKMYSYLNKCLSKEVIRDRVRKINNMCFIEIGYNDEFLLSQIDIKIDHFGPFIVVCLWDEESPLEIGGYLVVDNLSMGNPSMGGIRMLPDVTPADIANLARGMTFKNSAANLPYGGGKAGIVSRNDLADEIHTQIIQGFAKLIYRFRSIYIPGPDVGTNDNDMKTIAIENGLNHVVSKTADMGGSCIDEVGGAAGGLIIALLSLIELMPRLTVLPQFSNLKIPEAKDLTILFQGFGAVGAHGSKILKEKIPEAKTIGISDKDGYLYNEKGLPVEYLFDEWKKNGLVTKKYNKDVIAYADDKNQTTFFSANPNHLLGESAFCFIPAAPVANYIGLLPSETASININDIGNWSIIIEGANTFSPHPDKKIKRLKWEQIVYREKSTMIANDYLVNSGGVIFAAQEHLIPTPKHLQLPKKLLGDKNAVDNWLSKHSEAFYNLSIKRQNAGDRYRKKAIHKNMEELVDILVSNPGYLPCDASEQISTQRLTD